MGSRFGIPQDLAYGSLATYHALAIEGPIREHYVIGTHETRDEERTEIGWPIFHTGQISS